MKKALLVLSIITLLCFALLSSDQAKPETLRGKISQFSVSDMPNDDGAGVVLKWKPLDKSHRVINYRIYRGVSPDSLFLLSTTEVDPKLGVLAPELFYYDRGDQPIVEFETAPRKVTPEKQQAKGSPLYRRFPIDAKLLGSMIGRYNVFAAIKSRKMYKQAIPITRDEDILAGIKLYNFEYVFATPMPGQKYYYTIVAENERGKLLPYADIKEIVPEDNPPDNKAMLFSTFVSDTGVVNFEWTPSVSAPDIAMWEGWLAPKAMLPIAGEALPENWQASAIQLFQIPNYYGPTTCYHSVDTKAMGINLPPNMEDYSAVLSYGDYMGQMAATSARHFRIMNSSALPKQHPFKVMDKKNDKGDYTVASIGKPIAYVTSATFTSPAKKAIRINYEVSANEQFEIKKMQFTIFNKDGQKIGVKTEHFVDKTLVYRLPAEYAGILDMSIRIGLVTKGSKVFDPDYTQQHIVFDPVNKLFKGEDIYYRGEAISKLYFDVLTRNNFAPAFMFGNRTNGISRSFDHANPYEDILYQSLSGYDAKSKRMVLDPIINIAALPDSGLSFTIPLFRAKFDASMKKLETELAELKTAVAAYPAGAVPDSLSSALQQSEANYKFITTHPAYVKASKAKSDRAWLNTLLKTHLVNSRSYAYQLLKTDGKGAFVISDTYKNGNGNSWFFPKSEWFDSTKVITLFASILLCILLVYAIYITRRKDVFIRPIAGLHEIDNAIGRATEMGRPVMFVPGWGSLGDISTIASMMILNQIAKKAAEFDIRLVSPHCDYMVLPLAQEMVQGSFSEAGRPDAYNQNDIFFVSDSQFPFCAGVNGITVRERVATIFYMGYFNAEALLLTETGNQAGAIQIAGSDAVTQIPFFITTCDYTLIGEEFYAASAYLSRHNELVSMLKAQDYFKLIIVFMVILGSILSTLNITSVINALPVE